MATAGAAPDPGGSSANPLTELYRVLYCGRGGMDVGVGHAQIWKGDVR